MAHAVYHTPVGDLMIVVADGRLLMADWLCARPSIDVPYLAPSAADERMLHDVMEWLDGYFAGRITRHNFVLSIEGTPFQRAVRSSLAEIPYGVTATYADVARSAGHPRAVRAAASAISSNQLSIFLPCHRVVGTDGAMHGYRGGIAAKRYLLSLERKHSAGEGLFVHGFLGGQ